MKKKIMKIFQKQEKQKNDEHLRNLVRNLYNEEK